MTNIRKSPSVRSGSTLFALGAHKMADLTEIIMRLWLNSNAFKEDGDGIINPPLAQRMVRMIAKDAVNIISYQMAKEDTLDCVDNLSLSRTGQRKDVFAFATEMSKIPDMTLKQKMTLVITCCVLQKHQVLFKLQKK